MPLIVVGKTTVIPKIEVVLRSVEKGVPRVVDGLRERIREPQECPGQRVILNRDAHSVVIGIALAAVLLNVGKGGVRTAKIYSVNIAGASSGIQIALHDDVHPFKFLGSEEPPAELQV